MNKAKIRKTGKTSQFEVLEEGYSRKYNRVFARGVYQSFNVDDALPMRMEFYVQAGGISFAANNLTEAVELWVQYREDLQTPSIDSVQRVG